MIREVSASFQAVEDWLRSLGLLHYAQSFYDNGYEDLETCKLMKEEDLNVIDIKTDQDRQDILNGINKLKQNLYFELEPENSENLAERTKIEPIVLKTKLKECLEREKIQLTEPPYYNNDGTPGDLYPLAIRYAAELTTFFDDVLNGLEQLRNRQLSTQNYNLMISDSPSKVKRDQENRRSLRNGSNPAEYLNCETPSYPKRSSSFSKYDTRVTKSTTDLSKDIINAGGVSPKGKSKKSKGFLGGVFRRGAGSRTGHGKGSDFKASELTLTQNEIVDIFQQVKNNVMSQEDALDVIKRRGLTKSTSYDGGSPATTHRHLNDQNSISALLAREAALAKPKSKSGKGSLRNRCASAQFYTQAEDDISQSSASLISNESKSSLEISGDHTVGTLEEDCISISSKNSPEFGKPGIFKKIRNSIRKKNKLNEGELSSEEKETDGTSPPEKRLNNHDNSAKLKPSPRNGENTLFSPLESKEYTEHSPLIQSFSTPANITIPITPLVPPPPLTPPPPPPVDDNSSIDTQIEDFAFRDRTPSLKIKSYPMNQEEISKRRALEKNNNISKSEKNDVISHLDNEIVTSSTTTSNIDLDDHVFNKELITELNKVIPKVPPRPPRKLSDSSEPTPVAPPRRHSKLSRTESTDRQMDELVKEMNDITADLDTHWQHVNGDSSAPVKQKADNVPSTKKSESKKPEPPLKTSTLGWKKPVPPPRPNVSNENKSPVNSLGRNKPKNSLTDSSKAGKRKVSEMVSQKQLIIKKLGRENINLAEIPYTSKTGSWCVPYNLVKRYSDELSYSLEEVVTCFEEIRVEERKKIHQTLVPYTELDLKTNEVLLQNVSVDDYLIHIGLPMYVEDFRELGIKTVRELKELDEDDFKHIGIFDVMHITWLRKHLKGPTL